METFERTLEIFLAELSTFTGKVPTIKISYREESILVIDAPSGLIKQLLNNEAICAHLGVDGLKIQYFKR